jgi:hypothetical protein
MAIDTIEVLRERAENAALTIRNNRYAGKSGRLWYGRFIKVTLKYLLLKLFSFTIYHMIIFFLFHPYYTIIGHSSGRSESFVALVFCSSLIGIGETNNPNRRVTKFVPNLSIIFIG